MSPWSKTLAVALASASMLSAAVHAQPTVDVVEVASGFNQAIGLASADDGSGWLFVVQQSGQIRIWNGTEVLGGAFLDLVGTVSSGGEQGLLGLAFHPDYETNGLFYVNYTDLAGDTVVARYSVSAGDPTTADPGSALTVLTFAQPAGNHNGGDLHFGPDGHLYIASGDGGASWANGQDASTLLGKLLRIDVDGDDFPADPLRNYAIPPDNRFVGVAGAAEEIWNLGLRNPWRFSFDRLTGDLFIGDVGEGAWEEIDFAPSPTGAENWGWPCFEGADPFPSGGCPPGGSFDLPILVLPHDAFPNNNCSVIGGYRYRGLAYPGFSGWYFFTDWCTGTLWAAEPDGPGWTGYPVASLGTFAFTGFGEGEDGEIYATGGSRVVRLQDPSGQIFADGFESGSTSAWVASPP